MYGDEIYTHKDQNLEFDILDAGTTNTIRYTVLNPDILKFTLKIDDGEVTFGSFKPNSPSIRAIKKSENYELGDLELKAKIEQKNILPATNPIEKGNEK